MTTSLLTRKQANAILQGMIEAAEKLLEEFEALSDRRGRKSSPKWLAA
ncbi:MAG: hypothetical protein R2748_03810 [Bryobacterales bacterium]